jgi:hypothetical protein
MCTPNLAHLSTAVTGPYWGSDHLLVIIELSINSTPHVPPNPTWKFKESWQEWNEEIETQLKATQPNQNTETSYSTLYAAMMYANNLFFTPKNKTHPRDTQKPWWTKECKAAAKQARKAYQVWRSTLLQIDKTHLNKMEAIKKRTIIE